jgi:glucose dehydrogenase
MEFAYLMALTSNSGKVIKSMELTGVVYLRRGMFTAAARKARLLAQSGNCMARNIFANMPITEKLGAA